MLSMHWQNEWNMYRLENPAVCFRVFSIFFKLIFVCCKYLNLFDEIEIIIMRNKCIAGYM